MLGALLIFSVGSAAAQMAGDRCPTGYLRHSAVSRCFKVVTRPMSWYQSSQHCRADGARLIALESSEMQNAMVELLRSNLARRVFMRRSPAVNSRPVDPSYFFSGRMRRPQTRSPDTLRPRQRERILPRRGLASEVGGLSIFWTGGNDIAVEGQLEWSSAQPSSVAMLPQLGQLVSADSEPRAVYLNFIFGSDLSRSAQRQMLAQPVDKNCLATLAPYRFRWALVNCEHELAFICEMAPLRPVAPAAPIRRRTTPATSYRRGGGDLRLDVQRAAAIASLLGSPRAGGVYQHVKSGLPQLSAAVGNAQAYNRHIDALLQPMQGRTAARTRRRRLKPRPRAQRNDASSSSSLYTQQRHINDVPIDGDLSHLLGLSSALVRGVIKAPTNSVPAERQRLMQSVNDELERLMRRGRSSSYRKPTRNVVRSRWSNRHRYRGQ